jgi:hypothetical protein
MSSLKENRRKTITKSKYSWLTKVKITLLKIPSESKNISSPVRFLLNLCTLTLLMSNFDLQRLLFSLKEFLLRSIQIQHIFISISQSVKKADWSKVSDIKVRCCSSSSSSLSLFILGIGITICQRLCILACPLKKSHQGRLFHVESSCSAFFVQWWWRRRQYCQGISCPTNDIKKTLVSATLQN